jgi:hypothetical protein
MSLSTLTILIIAYYSIDVNIFRANSTYPLTYRFFCDILYLVHFLLGFSIILEYRATMPEEPKVRDAIVRTWLGPRKVRDDVKPYTKINVKPYVIIKREGKLLCSGNGKEVLPLVFDNEGLANDFAMGKGYDGCEFMTMELEQLVHMCRDPKINFNSFYLIDHRSQT